MAQDMCVFCEKRPAEIGMVCSQCYALKQAQIDRGSKGCLGMFVLLLSFCVGLASMAAYCFLA